MLFLSIISSTLSGIRDTMRPLTEMVDGLFYVMNKESIAKLDGVGLFLHRAFNNLYKDGATIVDKFVAFNLLVTKFEAFLKKLYYLMHNEEVKPQHVGENATWSNVIHDVSPLWDLKYSEDETKKQLHQWLLMVKEWRNEESHISPTASEQDLNAAVNIIITMYCYATGSCISELEMNGHNVEDSAVNNIIPMFAEELPSPVPYREFTEESVVAHNIEYNSLRNAAENQE